MAKYSRVWKFALLATVIITLLLSPSGAVAKGKGPNPVGTWFCTVQNPIIPTENLLLNINAGGTTTATSTISYIGLELDDKFLLGTGHGVWKTKGCRSIATTTYFFVYSPLEALTGMPPQGFLQGTLGIPCKLTVGGKWLNGKCDVHFYLPEDPDGDGVTNSPYPPKGTLAFPPVESDITCKRLPMMKKK